MFFFGGCVKHIIIKPTALYSGTVLVYWGETSTTELTYWPTGLAFPPQSERRDHPGPPIRKLTTTARGDTRKVMRRVKGVKNKQMPAEVKMEKMAVCAWNPAESHRTSQVTDP